MSSSSSSFSWGEFLRLVIAFAWLSPAVTVRGGGTHSELLRIPPNMSSSSTSESDSWGEFLRLVLVFAWLSPAVAVWGGATHSDLLLQYFCLICSAKCPSPTGPLSRASTMASQDGEGSVCLNQKSSILVRQLLSWKWQDRSILSRVPMSTSSSIPISFHLARTG